MCNECVFFEPIAVFFESKKLELDSEKFERNQVFKSNGILNFFWIVRKFLSRL